MQQTLHHITIEDLVDKLKPGDIGLTENPEGLGKLIRWFQRLDNKKAVFTHAFLVGSMTVNSKVPFRALIYESNRTINIHPLSQYAGKHICIIRHKKMDNFLYHQGIVEVHDNIGMIYPYYRLGLLGIDMVVNSILKKIKIKPFCKLSSIVKFDRPVCSELIQQFFNKCGIKTYFKKKNTWTGVKPSDIYKAVIKHKEIYEIIFDGNLSYGRK